MEEKIILLMEEIGCDHGEAQLALELANYDLEKAIKAIKSILKGIIVVKGRFFIENKNMFGLFIIIFNQRKESVIRITGVVSYNPVIYELSLGADWHFLEKSIYSNRLLEGSMLGIMTDTEAHFNRRISDNKDKFFRALADKNESKISEILFSDFFLEGLKAQVNIEEINLADYHQEQTAGEIAPLSEKTVNPDSNRLILDIEVLEDENGKKAAAISNGEVIFAHITDDREIAKYLSKLLGTKETQFIPVPVEDAEEEDDKIKLKLYFTPGIVGHALVKRNVRIKTAEESGKPFLKRLFGIK